MEMGLPWWASGLRLQVSIAQDMRLFSGWGTKIHLLPNAAKKKKKKIEKNPVLSFSFCK